MLVSYQDIEEIESQRFGNTSGEIRQVLEETSGQLYSYRVNSSAAYLGTRNVAELGAAIGIGSGAAGVYVCVARNGNADKNVTITVAVNGKLLTLLYADFRNGSIEPSGNVSRYIRFSTILFETIQEQFQLSNSLVVGVIEARLLESIESERIKCSSVTA